MLKIVFVCLLLLQGANAEPATQKASGQQENSGAQVSPASGDESQVKISNESNSASNGHNQKQDAPSDAFQRTQTKQYWVLVGTSVVTAVVLIVYTVFAGLQWREIKQQAARAGEQVGKMQGQLDAMNRQADNSDKLLAETASLVKQTERSIEVTQQNSIYAQRAYVAIPKGDVAGNVFKLRIENSGNTPANDVIVAVEVDLGYLPPEVPKAGTGQVTYVGVLASQGSFDVEVRLSFEPTAEQKLRIGDPEDGYRLWCVGAIWYDDVFESDPVLVGGRKTTFCFFQNYGSPLLQPWLTGNEVA